MTADFHLAAVVDYHMRCYMVTVAVVGFVGIADYMRHYCLENIVFVGWHNSLQDEGFVVDETVKLSVAFDETEDYLSVPSEAEGN